MLMVQNKSPIMYYCILALWAGCLVRFEPNLLSLFDAATGVFSWLVIAVFIGLLNLFWLFGCYYLMLAAFTVIAWARRPPPPPPLRECPRVAILYTTRDDFRESAVLSFVGQNYANFHVFLLDDSVTEPMQAQVDAFASRYHSLATVIRRQGREGFKAGNLNHALNKAELKHYPFFVIADADSVLPSGFIVDLLPLFGLSPDIGYVQANHLPNPNQETPFARDLCMQVVPLWNMFFGPKNQYGFVPFLGHGGIIRYDVWEAAGGFPEIVAEDLAFSTRAARLGYRGHFAHEVLAYEDFAAGYPQFRKQQQRYVQGVCEFLHHEIGPFLLSRKVRWFEKLDVLMACGSLLLPAIFLVFLLLFCVVMPWQFGVRSLLTVEIGGETLFDVPVLMLESLFFQSWSWDYFAMTSACTFAPAIGAISVAIRYPRQGVRMILLSAVPFLSILVMAAISVIAYLLLRTVAFTPTGGRVRIRFSWQDTLTELMEFFLGTLLFIMCVFTLNLSLLAFAISIWLGPVMQRVPWETPLLRPFLYAPYFLIVGGLAVGGTNLLAGQGLMMSIFFFHF